MPAPSRCLPRSIAYCRISATVAVFGLGGIGLNVVQGARIAGADIIVGVDLNPAREALARKFGMTHFLNPKDVPNIVQAIADLTDGGVDRLQQFLFVERL